MAEPRPASASWIDRLLAAVDRLPGPAWVAYAAWAAGLALLNNAVRWIEGSQPVGTFDPGRVADAPMAAYFLALMHYLNRSARSAVTAFRPVLALDDSEVERLQREITSIPGPVAWIATAVGVVAAVISVRDDAAEWGLTPTSAIATRAYVYLFASVVIVFLTLFIFHTVRQLRLVDRIHAMAAKLNLWHRQPVYAFSTLTAQTSLGIILVVYYYGFVAYSLDLFGPVGITAQDAVVAGALVLLAAAVFVLPLRGMQRLLAAQKRQLVAEADRRLERALARLHQLVESERFEQADGLNKALSSLVVERDLLARISTWPWRPETLRSLLSSIALPVLLFLITNFLGQALGLR